MLCTQKACALALSLLLLTGCGAQDETPSVIEPIPHPSQSGLPEPDPLPEDESLPEPEPVESSRKEAQSAEEILPAPEPEQRYSDELYISIAETETAREAASRAASLPQSAPPARSAQPFGEGTTASAIAEMLLVQINSERTRRGLSALGIESSMQLAAEMRAGEALNSLSHTRPDGAPYHTVFDEAGFLYAGKYHGENLALIELSAQDWQVADIAGALLEQWKESPGHEQNLFSPNYVQTGIGVTVQREGDKTTFGAAQLFAGL